MSQCVYDSYAGSAFGLVLLIPSIVPWAITLGSLTRDKGGRRGFEFTTFWYSFYLSFCQLVLYILQLSVHRMREDPFCGLPAAVFPSSAVFFVAASVSFVLVFAFIHNILFDWKYWVYALLFFIVPPCYLVWLQYNVWWEVLLSALLALVANGVFFVVLHTCVAPQMPYILNTPPNTWFNVTDTFIMNDEQEAQRTQLEELLK